MSAWIVSRYHIDQMVNVIRNGPLDIPAARRREWREDTTLSYHFRISPDALGRLLWQENVRSVQCRYPDSDPNGLPGPVDFQPTDAATYSYRQPAVPLTIAETAKAVDCYTYQSCECPDWKESQAYDLCRTLEATLLAFLPGYEEAPWGLEDPATQVTP